MVVGIACVSTAFLNNEYLDLDLRVTGVTWGEEVSASWLAERGLREVGGG